MPIVPTSKAMTNSTQITRLKFCPMNPADRDAVKRREIGISFRLAFFVRCDTERSSHGTTDSQNTRIIKPNIAASAIAGQIKFLPAKISKLTCWIAP